jgi:predicted Zn-dependent peptidase
MDIETFTFPNGIRIIHKQVPFTHIAHCGFVLDIGSRDEKPHQQGIAHFWEHMAFKGTKKRKAFHILNRLESVGGELNAYTTKEKICFYASFLDKHYEKAVELLSDITFDSIFPENQIERERNVILEEMAMYLDSPDDALQDEFDALVFARHPLGYNILGTSESVASFKREDFRGFIQENINTHQVIFSSVGNLPFKKVLKITEKYLANIPEFKGQKQREIFTQYQPEIRQKKHTASQAHCAIGRTAYSLNDPKRLIFFMINNILGGPSMNSRLNLALREKYGYVYSVESNYSPFTDTGLFAIYFATEAKHLQKSIQLVYKELKNLRELKLGTVQLHQAKEQLLGQLAMGEESNQGFMLMMGKSLLDLGYVEPLGEIFNAINKITSADILEVANELLQEKDLSRLIYLAEEE